MLKELHIQNLILIEDETVIFSEGFNVISGETGAGKSALRTALALLLGKRADSQLIRKSVGFISFMGDKNRRRCGSFQDLSDIFDQPVLQGRVQVVEGLIEKQYRGARRDRTRKGNALPLPT